jgi:hypothetical protein
MQVEVKSKPKAFEPIELKLTIESEKELHYLKEIFTLTLTIPEKLVEHEVIDEDKDVEPLISMMQKVLYTLQGFKG